MLPSGKSHSHELLIIINGEGNRTVHHEIRDEKTSPLSSLRMISGRLTNTLFSCTFSQLKKRGSVMAMLLTRYAVFLAQRDCCDVHDWQSLQGHLSVRDVLQQRGIGVLPWIAVIHSINIRRLQNNLSINCKKDQDDNNERQVKALLSKRHFNLASRHRWPERQIISNLKFKSLSSTIWIHFIEVRQKSKLQNCQEHRRKGGHSLSAARKAAAVSVVKNGFPVPAPKMTTRPFSKWRMALRRMYGSATSAMRKAVITRVGTPTLSIDACKNMAFMTVAIILWDISPKG